MSTVAAAGQGSSLKDALGRTLSITLQTAIAHQTAPGSRRAAEEQLQDCCNAVAALSEAMPSGLLEPFQLSLAGLSHFNHKVINMGPSFDRAA